MAEEKRVVMLSGASRGIGRAIAQGLLKEGIGSASATEVESPI